MIEPGWTAALVRRNLPGMAAPTTLAALREQRFPELALDCGRERSPGVVDVHQWRDWTEMPTTPDQLRIEAYLDAFDLAGRSILHIGIGNSGLAARFAPRAERVVGTTVVPSEVERAQRLGLPNYSAVLHNKYSGATDEIPGTFDFIVDNNPTTFCCCMNHLARMLDFYASSLSAKGQIVTEQVGLGWTINAPGSNPRWSFSFEDLAAVAPLAGLQAYDMSRGIFVLSRERPDRPPLAGRVAHALRVLRSRTRRAVNKLRA